MCVVGGGGGRGSACGGLVNSGFSGGFGTWAMSAVKGALPENSGNDPFRKGTGRGEEPGMGCKPVLMVGVITFRGALRLTCPRSAPALFCP